MLILIQTIFVTINLIIGLYDFSFYRIPNIMLASLLVLYAIYATLFLSPNTIMMSALVCAAVLLVTFILFATKVIGGGDAKYLTVASLWMGTAGILPFIFLVTLIGGGLALIYLVLRDHVQRCSDVMWTQIQKTETQFPALQHIWAGSGTGAEFGKRDNINARMLPYGVAIAIAAIIIMVNNPLTGL